MPEGTMEKLEDEGKEKQQEKKSPAKIVKETLQTAKGTEWKKAEALEAELDNLEKEKDEISKELESLREEDKQISEGLQELESFVSGQKDEKDKSVAEQIEKFKLRKKEISERIQEFQRKEYDLYARVKKIKENPVFIQRERDLGAAYSEESKRNLEKERAERAKREQEEIEKKRKELIAEMEKAREEIKKAAEALIKVWEEDKEHFLRFGGGGFRDEIDPWKTYYDEIEKKNDEAAEMREKLRGIDKQIRRKEDKIFKVGIGRLRKEKDALEEELNEFEKRKLEERSKTEKDMKEKAEDFRRRHGEADALLRKLIGKYGALLMQARQFKMLDDNNAVMRKEFPYASQGLHEGTIDYLKLFETCGFDVRTRERS